MSREYVISPPPNNDSSNVNDTPTAHLSVRSDNSSTYEYNINTEDDYYFETRDGDKHQQQQQHVSSPLEYSDESEVDTTTTTSSYRRSRSAIATASRNNSSSNRSNPHQQQPQQQRPSPESLLDNVYNNPQLHQQQPSKSSLNLSFATFNLFRSSSNSGTRTTDVASLGDAMNTTTGTATTEGSQQQLQQQPLPLVTTNNMSSGGGIVLQPKYRSTNKKDDEEMQKKLIQSSSSGNINMRKTAQLQTLSSQQQQKQQQQQLYYGPQLPNEEDDDDDSDDNENDDNRNRNVNPIVSSSDGMYNSNYNQYKDSSESYANNNWMVRLAYSFRSSPLPSHSNNKTYTVVPNNNTNDTEGIITTTTTANENNESKGHRRQDSDLLEEYPHYMGLKTNYHNMRHQQVGDQPPPPNNSSSLGTPWNNKNSYNNNSSMSRESSINNEDSPLMGVSYSFNRYSSNDSINYDYDIDPSLHLPAGASTTINNEDEDDNTYGSSSHDRKLKSFPNGSNMNKLLAAKLAAAFLQDYEANRPPTLVGDTMTFINHNITDYQMTLYHIKYSIFADLCRTSAVLAFFISSYLEQFTDITIVPSLQCYLLTALNIYAITILLLDIWLRNEFRGHRSRTVRNPRTAKSLSASTKIMMDKHEVRISRSEKLIQPLIFFCGMLLLENVFRVYIIRSGNLVLFTSILKPLVLFYVSSQARDAYEAVRRILRIVVRVLIMEMLLILMFAAVACRLFQQYDKFRNLGVAWVSLFELATTVVNPSIWMPIYQESKLSAVFFIFFIITTVFYLHSLVLSVVFQTYIQAASDIHERNASDKEDTVYLAFLALLSGDQKATNSRGTNTDQLCVDVRSVRQTLKILRPHYSSMKINALVEIVDPAGQGVVDYTTFRTKIRQALNASIRTARNASNLAMGVELIAAAIALINFIYVLLVSSKFNPPWFAKIQVQLGCFITIVAALELGIRFNPIRIPDFTPLTRLNATFDGSAVVAAVVSFIGIISFLSGRSYALEYILMGRALDMIRILRLFPIFRDVCRRTADVLPAIMGPLTMVVSTLHIFTYLGMAIWGGSVIVGKHPDEILSLYDLNNFNSYQEGSVTMFQVLAVNDWYAIADVFLFATRNSSRYVVYTFFILANIICVSIMLNVLTAFFVESFVTKLHDDKDAPAEATTTMHKDRTNLLVEPDVRRVTSVRNVEQVLKNERNDDHNSIDTTESEFFEFDVYERQGYDKIMQTVVGSAYHGDAARDICRYLEVYESLAPGRSTVGYLVCDQQTLERFGNRRFRTKAIGYLDESMLHSVVTDMHSELLALAPRTNFQDRSLVRTFNHKREPGKTLEISGAILRRHPTLSLFVSRTIIAK